MKNKPNPLYNPFSTICLRTPLMPLASIARLNGDENIIPIVRSFFETPLGQEALLLASPDLMREFKKYCQGGITEQRKKERLENTLLKYYCRLASRCTPFGLFAGYSSVKTGDHTAVEFKQPEHFNRNARLDMNYLGQLLDKISKDETIRPIIEFFPNSSLYSSAGTLRYVEASYKANKRAHDLVGVSTNEYLERILRNAENGITIARAAELIVEEEITIDIAHTFIDYLINNQILVSEFEPVVTGNDIADYINELLIKVKARTEDNEIRNKIEGYCDMLRLIRERLDIINSNRINDIPGAYEELKRMIMDFDIPFDEKHLIQVDLNKTTNTATLHESIVADIYNGLEIFSRFSPRIFRSSRTSQNNFIKFAKAFEERYETREVDLSEALDSEKGIGYIQDLKEDADYSDLLKRISIPKGKDEGLKDMTWDARLHSFWFRKFIEAAEKNAYEIELNQEDLDEFPVRLNECGETLSVMASLVMEEGDVSPRIQVNGVNGVSAAKLLGRFGTSNNEIRSVLQEIADKDNEHNPSAIVAEVVHLPEARVGNILLRPIIRKYEIPYLAKANVDDDFQIHISDLSISLKNGRIILRSKKLAKEIIPALSNAHNFKYNCLPVYQFLCDYSAQRHLTDIYINLGILYRTATFYPRITHKNIIIKQATWLFRKAELEMFLTAPAEQLVDKFRIFCDQYKIPRYVNWMHNDNSLLIDTTSAVFIRMFVREIKDLSTVVLVEFLHSVNLNSNTQQLNSFANELIVSFYRAAVPVKNETAAPAMPLPQKEKVIQRKFTFGDKWLYFKLYTGLKTAENVIANGIKPFIAALTAGNIIDKWFFIRYADPEYHLRLRVQIKDKDNFQQVAALFKKYFQPFEETEEIWKIQVDTYVRELERYGAGTIEESEEIFFHDSNFCVEVSHALNGNEGEKLRWQVALKSVDSYLDVFGYSPEQKIELLTIGRDGLGLEFNFNKELKSSLSDLYKYHTKTIHQLFNAPENGAGIPPVLATELEKRAVLLQKPVSVIVNAFKEKNRLNRWLLSCLHMNINRLFKSKRRLHEFVIYDLLLNYYKSAKARQIAEQKKSAVNVPLFIPFMLALLFQFLTPSFGQQVKEKGSLTGIVQDAATKINPELISVSLFRSNGKIVSGTLTDKSGTFHIQNIPFGNYYVVVSATGYEAVQTPLFSILPEKKTIVLDTIVMKFSEHKMAEVIVSAQKQVIRVEADKIIYSVENDKTSRGASALEAMSKVPLISVTGNDRILLKGSPNYKVYVDGKLSASYTTRLSDVLKSMPAESIKDIEIITNPSAKYDAEGTGGIINIITRRKLSNGYNGSVYGNVNSIGVFNAGAQAGAAYGKFNISLLGSTGNYRRPNNNIKTDQENYTANGAQQLHQVQNNVFKSSFVSTSLNIDYMPDSLNTISASVLLYNGKNNTRGTLMSEYLKPDLSIDNLFQRDLYRKTQYLTSETNVGYQHNFKRPNHYIAFNYRLNYDQAKIYYDIFQQPIDNSEQLAERNDNNEVNKESTLQVDFALPVATGQTIEAGIKNIFRRLTSKFEDYIGDSYDHLQFNQKASDQLKYKQDVRAGYAQYTVKRKKISFKTGVRIEYTDIDAELIEQKTKTEQSYYSFIPSASISITCNKQSLLKASYSRRIQRPGLFYLNPFINQLNPQNISYGNPGLRPEYVNSYELGYNVNLKKTQLNLLVFYQQTSHSIESYRFLKEDSVLVTTYNNFGNQSNLGMNVYVSTSAIKNMSLSGNITGGYYSAQLNSNNASRFNNGFNTKISVNASYNFIKGLTGLLSAGYYAPATGFQSRSYGYTVSNVGLTADILKSKASITLNLSQPFLHRSVYKTAYSNTGFYQLMVNRYPERFVRLGFRYKFGNATAGKKNATKVKNDDLKSSN